MHTGPLLQPKRKVTGADFIPVNQIGIDLIFRPGFTQENIKLIQIKIIRVCLLFWQQVTSGQFVRDIPVGVDHNMTHRAAEARGRTGFLTDNDSHIEFDVIIFDGSQLVAAEVDQQITLTQIIRQPAEALQVNPDFIDHVLCRYIQCGQGIWSDNAVLFQAVLSLKYLDRLHQSLVIAQGAIKFRSGQIGIFYR